MDNIKWAPWGYRSVGEHLTADRDIPSFIHMSSSIFSIKIQCRLFVAASHQTRLDTRSKARRPIKVGIKGRGGRERAET